MTTDPGSGVPASAQGAPAPAQNAPAADPMAALVDIRNQVIRLGQEIAAMRSEPAQGSDAMNAVVAELREAVRFLAERLDGVARMVAQRGEELADTRGALGAIDAHVRSQAETIGVLTTGMQVLPSYGQQVSGLQDNVTALQQRIGSLEGSLGQRLGGIEQAVSRPADAGISDRLSAIEGMLGPLAQRLGQAHSEHAASLQALHGKVESLASGTQAALAQPASLDETAVAALDPKLAALSGEIQSLRSDVSAALAARSASGASGAPVDLAPLAKQLADMSGELESLRSDIAGVVAARGAGDGSAPVDLSPLSKQLADLSDKLSTIGSAAPTAGAAAGGGEVDAAAEERIKAHVDDAIMALAQTLLGRVGAVALVDEPAPPPPVAPPAAHADDTEPEEYDESDVDDSDVAQIDFSRADLEDEDADTVSWERPVSDDREDDGTEAAWSRQPGYEDSPTYAGGPEGSAPVPGVDQPFDQEAVWGAPQLPPEGPSTVVPDRRRRWFSW